MFAHRHNQGDNAYARSAGLYFVRQVHGFLPFMGYMGSFLAPVNVLSVEFDLSISYAGGNKPGHR
jgi:hypothetical protein